MGAIHVTVNIAVSFIMSYEGHSEKDPRGEELTKKKMFRLCDSIRAMRLSITLCTRVGERLE